MYAAVYDELLCEVTCVVHVKYCNHLLAVHMAGVACRNCGVRVVGRMPKDIAMGVYKYCGVVRSYLVWLVFGNSIPICL